MASAAGKSSVLWVIMPENGVSASILSPIPRAIEPVGPEVSTANASSLFADSFITFTFKSAGYSGLTDDFGN